MWRSKVKFRKFQMTIMVIIVMLSSLILSVAMTILLASDKPMKKLIEQTNAPDLFLIVNTKDSLQQDTNEIVQIFQEIKDVTEIQCIENVTKLRGTIYYKDEKITTTSNYFMTYNEGDFGNLHFLSEVKALQDGECYIGTATADNYDIGVGDFIDVKCSDYIMSLKVVGIYSEPYSVSASLGCSRIYINQNQLKLISGDNVNLIVVYGNDSANDQVLFDTFTEKNKNNISVSSYTLSEAKLISELSQKMLGGFIIGFAIIILLVSSTVIRSSIMNNISKEFKTIGIYKAMGYSSNTIIGIYIKTYSYVLIASTVIGAGLSTIISNYIVSNNYKLYGIDSHIDYLIPLSSTIVFLSIYILIVVYTGIKQIKNIEPVEALTMNDRVDTSRASIKGLENNFSPLCQSIRKIVRHKKSSGLLFLVLFISSYMVCFSITCYSNVSKLGNSASFWFGIDKSTYRVYVTDNNISNEVYQFLDNKEEVTSIVKGSLLYLGAQVSENEHSVVKNLALQCYNNYENNLQGDIIEGRNPIKDNEIALSKKILNKMDKKIGDSIELLIANKNVTFEIVGSFQTMFNNAKYARVKESAIESVDLTYKSTNICFDMKHVSDYSKLKKELLNKYANKLDVEESKNYLKDSLEPIEKTQKIVLIPFSILVMLIGAINVFSIVSLLNVNSRKEFTIYRAIGYPAKDLIHTNEIYVTLSGILAMIIGIPVFMVSYSKIMNFLFRMLGIYNYPTDYNVPVLILSLVVVIAVCILSTAISSSSIKKIQVQNLNGE